MSLHLSSRRIVESVCGALVLCVAAFSLSISTRAQTTAAAVAPPTSRQTGQSRFAKLDGMRVHYQNHGAGDEALVFVHGWTCNLNFWRMQVPAFAGRMRVIAIDLPGHGESDKPNISYTQDLFARSVEAVLRDAGVRRAVLAGHSMGTPVVRQFYRKYPEKTLALVIVDGTLRPFAPGAVMSKYVEPLRRPNYKEAAGAMIDGMLSAQMEASLREEIKSSMLRTPQHVAVSAFEGMYDDAVWTDDQIKVPALAVLAASPFWPPDNEQRFRKIAPDMEYHLWQGVTHFLMMDKPAEFNRTLQSFLARRRLLKQTHEAAHAPKK